jgi:hypothetical protein
VLKIFCLIGIHDHYIVEELITGFRKIGCRRCKKQWLLDNQRKKLVPWIEAFKNSIGEISDEKSADKV